MALVRIVGLALLVVGLAGVTPVFAALTEPDTDCCAGEAGQPAEPPEGAGDAGCDPDECPPSCDDCVYRTASFVPRAVEPDVAAPAARAVEPRRAAERLVVEPPPRGLFRPPRVLA